jgi:hypothetical protein
MEKRNNPKIEAMRERSLIIESERKNSRTPKFYITEQEEEIKRPAGDPYEYKKDENGYYFKKRDEENWKKTNNSAVKAVFGSNVKKSATKSSGESKSSVKVPFKNTEEGNAFRQWVNNTHPDYAKEIDLDKEGSYNNSYVAKAWNKYGGEYQNKKDSRDYINKYQLDYINKMTAKQDTFRPEFYLPNELKLDPKVRKIAKDNGVKEKEIGDGSWIKRFIKDSMKNLPLHVRSVIYYILGRESEMNEDELTIEEKKFLYSVADNYGVKDGLKYNLWRKLGAKGLPTAITKSGIESETSKLNKSTKEQLGDIFPNLSGQFMYTLGEVDKTNVNKGGDTIEIKDNYDMNSFGKEKDSLLDNVSEVFDLWKDGKASLYSLIRATISLREMGGYKGFPVNFKIKGSEVT